MISPDAKRYMHLFKPDWSPETLLAGNYIFHLMCYRRTLLKQLGGYRSELDGSQDYDLILRAAETQPQVRHIAKVLYHWRQYQGSVALDSNAKDYAFKAGVKALNQALKRREIKGEASEIKDLWRGNYQLNLPAVNSSNIQVIALNKHVAKDAYTTFVNQALQNNPMQTPFIALISTQLTPANEQTLGYLGAWLNISGVGLASGAVYTEEGKIEYIGATYQKNGSLLFPYQGYPMTELGYMACTRLVRNISAPYPDCVIFKREIWDALNGLNTQFKGRYALLDFALKAQAVGWRCLCVPHAKFIRQKNTTRLNELKQEQVLFYNTWLTWLEQGDPYYNKHLNREQQESQYCLNV